MDVQSGRRDDRAESKRMVEAALVGGANVIVVQWLDRFGRNLHEILSRIWQLRDHGIDVVATDKDIGEELILLMRAGLAGAESRRNSEHVRSYMSSSVGKRNGSEGVPTGNIDHSLFSSSRSRKCSVRRIDCAVCGVDSAYDE